MKYLVVRIEDNKIISATSYTSLIVAEQMCITANATILAGNHMNRKSKRGRKRIRPYYHIYTAYELKDYIDNEPEESLEMTILEKGILNDQ